MRSSRAASKLDHFTVPSVGGAFSSESAGGDRSAVAGMIGDERLDEVRTLRAKPSCRGAASVQVNRAHRRENGSEAIVEWAGRHTS